MLEIRKSTVTSHPVNPSLSIYLDAIRLLAAALVMLGHAHSFTGGHFSLFAGHGTASVAVFFVLSGFVIAFVTEKKEQNGTDYLISRLARMYSVALPAIAITLTADLIGYNTDPRPYLGLMPNTPDGFNYEYLNLSWGLLDILRLATFTNELWTTHIQVGSGEPYWSLGFEVWYYIIFGIYHFSPGSKTRRLALSAIAAIIAGPKICAYLPLWLLGVGCYRIMRSPWAQLSRIPVGAFTLLFIATPFTYILARKYLAPLSQSMFRHENWGSTTIFSIIYFHLIGLIFIINLISFQQITTRLPKPQAHIKKYKKEIQWLAGATFTLYLVHQPLLLMCLAINPLKEYQSVWAYTSFAATLALVFLLAQFTERKKDIWKKLFSTVIKRVLKPD